VYCTSGRAKEVTGSLLVVSIIVTAVRIILMNNLDFSTDTIVHFVYLFVFNIITPVAVLVINMIVVREVRRASNNAAVNLGLQQHQQSTSSNSAVPTVMLVTTSLVYLLLQGTWSIINVIFHWTPVDAFSPTTRDRMWKVHSVAEEARDFVYCYNFYVYVITGKQFRSELRKLFCRCRPAAAESANDVRQISAETRV